MTTDEGSQPILLRSVPELRRGGLSACDLVAGDSAKAGRAKTEVGFLGSQEKARVLISCLIAVAACLVLVGQSSGDELRVRQGSRSEDIDASEQTVFSSPMIFEMPFPSTSLRSSVREVFPPGMVSRYSCDGVSIFSLGMKGPQKGEPGTKVHFKYVVRVAKGQDKLVSIRFRVSASGKNLLELVDRAIKVEEEGLKIREIAGAFDSDYPDDTAQLQITVVAKNR